MSESIRIDTLEGELALSPQQKQLRSSSGFRGYKRALVGDRSLCYFLGFEFYTLCLAGLGGAIGLLLRQQILPFFLKSCSGKFICACGVTIRHPERLSIGAHAFLDEGVLLDQRGDDLMSSSIEIGESVVIGRGSILVAKEGRILLHPGVNISSNCRIATQSKVEIGESSLIAAFCYIGPGNHRTDTSDDTPLIERGMEIKGGVSIGRDVWIGAHSTILDGVTIGDGAVIGAHSLVRSDVAPKAVVAGVPAKVLRAL
jgi:acetyltransferase-like isoleucine patch superfamily enzyme